MRVSARESKNLCEFRPLLSVSRNANFEVNNVKTSKRSVVASTADAI